jgi:hypothetical protein
MLFHMEQQFTLATMDCRIAIRNRIYLEIAHHANPQVTSDK